MRDSFAIEESGDQTVANRRSVSEGSMFGSAVGRRRRSLWAILAFLFAIGFVVSAFMVRSDRNEAFDSVVERARDEAQLATATLTGRQLTRPITGTSYDRVAAKIWKSVSSKGSIAGVTIWSSRGRILFSLNESRVGNTPADMQPLIAGIANGSDSTRVLDGTVQTFTRVSKGTDGPVAIVEVDQPFALVEAQTGGLWSTLRLASAFGLAVSLLLLGLTFVPSNGPPPAREDAEPARLDERQEADEAEETKAERQQPGEPLPTEKRSTYAELFGLESDLHAGIPARAPEDGDRPGDEASVMDAGEQPSAEPLPAEQLPTEPIQAEQLPTEPIPAEPVPGERPVEELPAEQLSAEESTPTSEEDVQALHADLNEAMAQVDALDVHGESPESMDESIGGQWPEEFRDVFQDMARGGDAQTQEMRQRREEFKNRAKQAELRLKKLDAELHEAPSAPSTER
jgi:hypothetical protein